ncbi:hypothetical protein FKM82_018446 [Ascaphus truei]
MYVCMYIYLLSSLTDTTSPPNKEEKKEMEKLCSWYTATSMGFLYSSMFAGRCRLPNITWQKSHSFIYPTAAGGTVAGGWGGGRRGVWETREELLRPTSECDCPQTDCCYFRAHAL